MPGVNGRGARVGTILGVRVAGPGVELLPFEGPWDVVIDDAGRIADLRLPGILPPVGDTLDGDGAWLVPGLWDHHVHVVQAALAARRHPLGDVKSAHVAAEAMAGAAMDEDGRRVGTGFRDALWPDLPSLDMLDAATGDVATYLINADVHSVWLNTAAFRREGMTPVDSTGLLREEPAFEISRRLNAASAERADAAVARFAQGAAARGVVGLVDFDMGWNPEAWQRRTGGGFDTLRIEFGTYPAMLDRLIAEGWTTGDRVSDLVTVGSLKVISDGSLGTRTAACSHPYAGTHDDRGVLTVPPGELRALMTEATANGISCAIHAIGDLANSHALDAFAVTGARGSIEHAQLVSAVDVPRFARLGVTASVQPEHALDDRDMTDTLWAHQTAMPYPLRALADSGANLTLGSDAPVAALDPWAAMASAVFRTRDGREAWQPGQALPLEVALAASTHGGSEHPARIAVGEPADLVLCETDPRVAGERELRAMEVRATLVGGRITHLG
ncbi:amidohydrolase [Microbacterium sediminicola]|uniref:Amidohydrolase n=1 Tax=Microbacterium sediminicola TaxID=415210 RepID=A0ABP4TQ65_9MICO